MAKPAWEMADVVRRYGDAYRRQYHPSAHQIRVLQAIERCRTSALGGHVQRCAQCDFTRISYNSCRNRHCPKCQGAERAEWLEKRKAELLPIEYFHLVFTVPAELNALALENQRVFYGLLFRISAETLLTIARDPKHLGAEIGFFSILHTWGQNLLFHPHVHCVATGGGLSPDGERWIACKPGFFLPVRVLSALFRNLLLDALQQAFDKRQLTFPGGLSALADAGCFASLLGALRNRDWVVYCKPPFGGPEQVLAYLARYTHRVAIANERLTALHDTTVTFRWKDYRKPHRPRLMTLEGRELLRRFLLHVVPRGLQRIRHYGLGANCHRGAKLAHCRRILSAPVADLLPIALALAASACLPAPAAPPLLCPNCRTGQLVRLREVPKILVWDSS